MRRLEINVCSIVLDLFLDFQNVFIFAKGFKLCCIAGRGLNAYCGYGWSWSDVLMGECFDKRL